jgi:hypothetical protein
VVGALPEAVNDVEETKQRDIEKVLRGAES